MTNRGRHRLTCLPWSHVLFTVSVRLESYHQRKVKSSWTFNYCRIWQHTLTNWSIHNHPLKKNKKTFSVKILSPERTCRLFFCVTCDDKTSSVSQCNLSCFMDAFCHVLWMQTKWMLFIYTFHPVRVVRFSSVIMCDDSEWNGGTVTWFFVNSPAVVKNKRAVLFALFIEIIKHQFAIVDFVYGLQIRQRLAGFWKPLPPALRWLRPRHFVCVCARAHVCLWGWSVSVLSMWAVSQCGLSRKVGTAWKRTRKITPRQTHMKKLQWHRSSATRQREEIVDLYWYM